MFKKLFVVLTLVSSALAFAVDLDPGNPNPSDDSIHDTSLIQKKSNKVQWGDFLRFQAEERKTFFSDLALELSNAKAEWQKKHDELLLEQREARHDFEPEDHTIDERREFYVNQRENMARFRKEQNQALDAIKTDHQKRRDAFHKRQKQDRAEFRKKLRMKPEPDASPAG